MFRIMFKGRPAGIAFQSRQSAEEYLAVQRPNVRPMLTIVETRGPRPAPANPQPREEEAPCPA